MLCLHARHAKEQLMPSLSNLDLHICTTICLTTIYAKLKCEQELPRMQLQRILTNPVYLDMHHYVWVCTDAGAAKQH